MITEFVREYGIRFRSDEGEKSTFQRKKIYPNIIEGYALMPQLCSPVSIREPMEITTSCTFTDIIHCRLSLASET
jgi:hypothetical protein